MLVLSRRVGEEIVIDNEIRIMVVSIRGGTVRLGISAPPSIPVDREEVREQRAALLAAAAANQEAGELAAVGQG
jgi:carbon storage regulator